MNPSNRANTTGGRTSTVGEEATTPSGSRRHDAFLGLFAGFIATIVMTVFRVPISRSPPPTAWVWAKYLGAGDPEAYVIEGLGLHLVYGSAGGGMFGLLAGRRIVGSDTSRVRIGFVAGSLYGLVLSVFGLNALLRGLLDMRLDPDERFVFHVSHVLYGITLGTVFGSRHQPFQD